MFHRLQRARLLALVLPVLAIIAAVQLACSSMTVSGASSDLKDCEDKGLQDCGSCPDGYGYGHGYGCF